MLATILLVFAFVCFTLAALQTLTTRVNLTAAGLAFWVASLLFRW